MEVQPKTPPRRSESDEQSRSQQQPSSHAPAVTSHGHLKPASFNEGLPISWLPQHEEVPEDGSEA